MANSREAFERILTSFPKFKSGPEFTPSSVLDYYTQLETRYNSELFGQDLLMKRLDSLNCNQYVYDSIFLKIKEVYRLLDQLYEVKYN
jgi:hypothetical protein